MMAPLGKGMRSSQRKVKSQKENPASQPNLKAQMGLL
jgi:hypothetical protein